MIPTPVTTNSTCLESREVVGIVQKGLSDRVFVALLVGCLAVAYAAEIGTYTYNADHFWELATRASKYSSWLVDGRYLGEVIRYTMLDGYYLPSFLLMVGLSLLVIVGVLLAGLWGIDRTANRLVFVLLIVTFPFFFETFSYFSLRHTVPLAISFAVFGVVTGGLSGFAPALRGALSLFAALLLYQAAIYFAFVVLLAWSALLVLRGTKWTTCGTVLLLPKSGVFLIAGGLYGLLLLTMNALLPVRADRLAALGGLPQSMEQFRFTLSAHLKAAAYFFVESAFLFPLAAKIVLLTGLVVIVAHVIVGLATRRLGMGDAAFVVVLVAVLPLAAHGINLALYPPWTVLFGRVLIAYSAVYASIFAIALLSSSGLTRRVVTVLFGVSATIFVYQANVWHQFQHLKNLADFEIARAISERLKNQTEYRPGLPLVMVGTFRPTDYLHYRAFDLRTGRIDNTITESVYALNWAKERVLMFFMPLAWPSLDQMTLGRKLSLGAPVWPAPGSVFIKDGLMVVVLGREPG